MEEVEKEVANLKKRKVESGRSTTGQFERESQRVVGETLVVLFNFSSSSLSTFHFPLSTSFSTSSTSLLLPLSVDDPRRP
jgi:hypothetical protein